MRPENQQEPEFSFNDSELHIQTMSEEIRIRSWPELLAQARRNESDWANIRPEFRLIKPAGGAKERQYFDSIAAGNKAGGTSLEALAVTESKEMAFQAFCSSLPSEVAGAVEPFQSSVEPACAFEAGKGILGSVAQQSCLGLLPGKQ